jgi:peptidoglycan-N-acetylglucosamine deacetylase
MVGWNAAAFPAVARQVAAAGHMIVNHTWNHYNLHYLPAVAVQDEIARTADAIHAATGARPDMFRTSYGVWPPTVFRYCARVGLTPLAWPVRQPVEHLRVCVCCCPVGWRWKSAP